MGAAEDVIAADGAAQAPAGEQLITGPGIYEDLPDQVYHRGPGISKSGLDLIKISPALYKANRDHPRPPTPAMVIGSAFHTAVLEPERFAQVYVAAPDDAPRRPTDRQIHAKKPSAETVAAIQWWQAWDADNAGKIVLDTKAGEDPFWQPSDWDLVQRMADAVRAHPIASILLAPDDGAAEISVFWQDRWRNRLCKCRPDFTNWAHDVCVDLKSSHDATFSGFQRSVIDFRYHVQEAWYTDGQREAGCMPRNGFVFVAVEKRPPWHVGVYRLEPEAVRMGRVAYRRDLDLYSQCKAADEWPGLDPAIRPLPLPPWAERQKIS